MSEVGSTVQNFLVEFNRRTGQRRVRAFSSAREATLCRLQLERERVNTDIEICALSTDSLEALQTTHSRYFSGEEMSDDDADRALRSSQCVGGPAVTARSIAG